MLHANLNGADYSDEKYVVMKSEDFGKHWGARSGVDVNKYRIKDAVVIRRQDLFASSALAGYAASIAVAISVMVKDDPRRQQLLQIADYFEHQSKLAADEGFKLPDL